MIRYYFAGDDGCVSDRHVSHYRDIAAGGQGLIVQEATCVSYEGRWVTSQLGIWSDQHIEGLRRITDAVHEANGKIFIQLHHAGARCWHDPVGPGVCSALRGFNGPQTSRALPADEIAAIVRAFGEAAVRAVESGYDGIEIHGAHGYLISSFLNSELNRREDAYGQDRALLSREVLSAVRNAVGPDVIVGFRIGGFEPDFNTGMENALSLAAMGADFLDISFGCDPQTADPPAGFPYPPPFYAAMRVKECVDIPVFGVQHVTGPGLAGEILNYTDIDMIDIGRGVLINPSWANDALAGRDVGECLDCKICLWRIDYTKCPGRIKFLKSRGA